jgi:hypothetical protein
MFYKTKVAVCSEIRTKHINTMWAPRRIFLMLNLVYVNLPLGFERLRVILSLRGQIFHLISMCSFRVVIPNLCGEIVNRTSEVETSR